VRIEPLGDAAMILRELPGPPHAVAAALTGTPGVLETVPSFETVGVYFDPMSPPCEEDLQSAVTDLLLEGNPGRRHVVPVCYELGEDLREVAEQLQLPPEEVVALHTGSEYRCFAIGFCPGFPYLGPLPSPLDRIGRRLSPRPRVPAGAVAIAAGQAGIYTLPKPGGWAILGRTPLCLVDVEERYFPIRAGDQVRFARIGRDEYEARLGERL
jgi:inhibitor of KinA